MNSTTSNQTDEVTSVSSLEDSIAPFLGVLAVLYYGSKATR